MFHYKYSLQQIFTPDFNCNAASFLENLTKVADTAAACLLRSGLGCLMFKGLLLRTAKKEKKIYRPKRRATATKGEALLVLVRQYRSRRCLPPPSLSLAERRRSFLTASSFGQDWILSSHPHLWFADLRGVFAAAALAVVRASISGLEAALETSRQLTDTKQ